jgi:hypothetical protein
VGVFAFCVQIHTTNRGYLEDGGKSEWNSVNVVHSVHGVSFLASFWSVSQCLNSVFVEKAELEDNVHVKLCALK